MTRPLPPHRARPRGVALVIVLCFVVLLSGLVVAYFSQVTATRQISDSSLNQNRADELARSALEIVVGDLKQEIADQRNSTASAVGSATPQATIYAPLTAANLLPARSGTSDSLPNLVRRSWSGDGATSNLYYKSKASAVNSTADASALGRTISAQRWNSPYLLPRVSGANPTDATPVSNFTSPDWVFVTGAGPAVLTAPSSAVLGRYAYAVYDEGGLLDVNTAGYPTPAPVDQSSHKTALAYADLQQVGVPQKAVGDLVGWRNYASVQPDGSFPTASTSFTMTSAAQFSRFDTLVTGDLYGFLRVNSGATWNNRTDQAFLSRQQLLKFCASLNDNLGPTDEKAMMNALQYLGTFSRDVGAPSWFPTTPNGSNTDYYAGKDLAASANRDLLRVRVPFPSPSPGATPFTRADGTTAMVGEPLLKKRFPLSRLGELSYTGVSAAANTTLINGVPSAATADTVQRDFGLRWTTDHWVYCGPSPSTTIQSSIATLGSITNREPNFFELLKAGMLSGSLGRGAGAVGTYATSVSPSGSEEGPASGLDANDTNKDLQIIQIGANIIDQYDSDSFPTEIWFNNSATNLPVYVYGIENLPYLHRVIAKTLQIIYSNPQYLYGCYMAEIWNPHQAPATLPLPTQFQFAGEGQAQMWGYYNSNDSNNVTSTWTVASVSLDPGTSNGGSGYLAFTVPSTGSLRDPTFLTNDSGNSPYLVPTTVSGTNGTNNPSGWGPPSLPANTVCGLYAGTIPTTGTITCGIAPFQIQAINTGPIAPVAGTNANLVMKYLSPVTNTYKVYQRMKNLSGTDEAPTGSPGPNPGSYTYEHADPRTDRFGTALGEWLYGTSNTSPGQSIRPDTSAGVPAHGFFPRPSSGFTYMDPLTSAVYTTDAAIANHFYPGTLSDNVVTSTMRYADPDGIQRAGAGAYSTGNDGRPLISGNATSRPIILNRPFRNVGELGYAYRDAPWRNVDFFTANSADGALLDLFCVQENLNERGLVAGQVSLNTRQPAVLQAIISGAMKDEVNATTLGSTTDAANIAAAITALTASTPFVNRSELLAKAAAALAPNTSQDQQVKIRREAALRALSDVGQTRTWNLMIDVIAQSGRYAPNATDVKKFTVKGEKRYWLHVAIDRYTGEVIDRVLEPVYE